MSKNNTPGISVIMPCYNTEKYIKKTLDSLFGQSFKDIELIMVDDGSTDSTPKIIDKCEAEHPDIVKVIHKENGGQSIARNVAMECATGEYIVFWDSDDYADVDYLETLYTAAKENDSEMVLSGSHYVNEYGVVLENLHYPVIEYPKYALRRLSPHGKIYKREFLERHNIRYAEGKRYEDNPFNLQALFLSRNFVILPYSGHYQVVHTGSTTSSVMDPNKIPYDALEDAIKYVNAHKDEVNDYDTFEFTVLGFMTYFIFLGNREHIRTAHHVNKGFKYDFDLIGDLCDFAQRVIPKELPNYSRNPHVGIFKEKPLQLRHRAGVWLFTKLLKTHTLKAFAKVYYVFVR